MDPDQREAWARRLMDDPKVNGEADGAAADPLSPEGMESFADAMLRRQRERRQE